MKIIRGIITALVCALFVVPAHTQTTGGVPSRLRINSLGVGTTPPAGIGNGHFTGNVQAASFNGDPLTGVLHNGDSDKTLGNNFTVTNGTSDVNMFLEVSGGTATDKRWRFRSDGVGNMYVCAAPDVSNAWSTTDCFLTLNRSGLTRNSASITANTLNLTGTNAVDVHSFDPGSSADADFAIDASGTIGEIGAFTRSPNGVQTGGYLLSSNNAGTTFALTGLTAATINGSNICRANGTGCPSAGSIAAAGSDTQVQFNDGGNFGGDSDFIWNKTTNTLTLGSLAVQMNLRAPNALTATAAGAPINITSGAGGATSGVGGDLNLTSGSSTANAGGALRVTSGASSTGTAGTVTVAGGSASGGGDGGNLVLQGGTASSGNGLGGDIQLIAGNSAGAAEGGDISITTGTSSGAGGTGDLTINAGTGTVDITASALTFNGSALPSATSGSAALTSTDFAPVLATASWYKIGSQACVHIPAFTQTSSTTGFTFAFPGSSSIQSTSTSHDIPVYVTDNGVQLTTPATLRIQPTSLGSPEYIVSMLVAGSWTSSGFTNSGQKGFSRSVDACWYVN